MKKKEKATGNGTEPAHPLFQTLGKTIADLSEKLTDLEKKLK
jgi:hypothetical protein